MVVEGQEKEQFWTVLGGKAEYSSAERLKVGTPFCLYILYIFLYFSLSLLLDGTIVPFQRLPKVK